MSRVKHYQATVYYTSTGSTSTGTYTFTEAHAREAGADLTEEGLDIGAARRLCAAWTRRGSLNQSVRYSYSLCVDEYTKVREWWSAEGSSKNHGVEP